MRDPARELVNGIAADTTILNKPCAAVLAWLSFWPR